MSLSTMEQRYTESAEVEPTSEAGGDDRFFIITGGLFALAVVLSLIAIGSAIAAQVLMLV